MNNSALDHVVAQPEASGRSSAHGFRAAIIEAAFGFARGTASGLGQGSPLPYRAVAIGDADRILVTNDAGEFTALNQTDFAAFVAGRLTSDSQAYDDLVARHMLLAGRPETALRLLATKVRTKKAFVQQGPVLHILVPTLRCHQSCLYCQVSRRPMGTAGFDMSPETALHAVERILESDAAALTVEFQGGEPLLGFDIIKLVVETIRRRAPGRRVTFSITSTLHHLTEDIAAFLAEHDFQVSASIDGPEDIHNANRPLPGADAHRRTMEGAALARRIIGSANVAAITTITRRGLDHPEAIVDSLIEAGFELRARGFYNGPVDGIMSSSTASTLRQFQQSRRPPQSGVLDNATLAALGVNCR